MVRPCNVTWETEMVQKTFNDLMIFGNQWPQSIMHEEKRRVYVCLSCVLKSKSQTERNSITSESF